MFGWKKSLFLGVSGFSCFIGRRSVNIISRGTKLLLLLSPSSHPINSPAGLSARLELGVSWPWVRFAVLWEAAVWLLAFCSCAGWFNFEKILDVMDGLRGRGRRRDAQR